MPSFPEPEAETLRRARLGDAGAFEEIVRMTQRHVVALAQRILGDPSLAEDCAQEAYLRAFRGLAGFRAGRPFAPWLATVVVNRARDLRGRLRGGGLPLEDVPDRGAPPREADWEAGVRQAVQALPLPYREAISLHYLCGFDCASVARITGRPEGTVKSDLLRGRALLRRRLAAVRPEEGRP